MIRAVEKVRERLLRAAKALAAARVPYAVVGGNAVAAWVSRVDEAAVRNTRDVDILLRRADFDAARRALESEGFIYRRVASLGRAGALDLFLDGPNASARDAVHVVFAGEKVGAESVAPSPDVSESEQADQFRVVSLEALVRMKLTAFRDKDRTHLRDLIEVGLVLPSILPSLPPELRSRLQLLFDAPEG
ncbi:MAG TPA: nucleotidyl transferase AbiEii/AbiGii toxin family protein [Verrucomicrobiae bacterium]|nr:nucleotidyl transferase AbiEii/AbiGii toxin family protein [Verrucomicrobiae bacterium]